MAQSVARILGKDEVTSSNLVSSSTNARTLKAFIYKGFGRFFLPFCLINLDLVIISSLFSAQIEFFSVEKTPQSLMQQRF